MVGPVPYGAGMATLVLTVLGDDRTGLVDALAGVITDHDGNWVESHMARLAGKFAGIVVVTVADRAVDDVTAALAPLEADGLLDVTVQVAADTVSEGGTDTNDFDVELVGPDRAGVVQDLAGALAVRDVNIIELDSVTRPAPMGGGSVFEVRAWVQAPAAVDLDTIDDALAPLGPEFMIEIQART